MRVTYIIKNVTDVFYHGSEHGITGLLNMPDMDKFNHLNKVRHDMGISQKIGNGQFRDAVELNSMLKKNPSVKFSLEPRKGYKLATFEFA